LDLQIQSEHRSPQIFQTFSSLAEKAIPSALTLCKEAKDGLQTLSLLSQVKILTAVFLKFRNFSPF